MFSKKFHFIFLFLLQTRLKCPSLVRKLKGFLHGVEDESLAVRPETDGAGVKFSFSLN